MKKATRLLFAKLRNVLWSNSPAAQSRGRAILRFTKKIGLVYFGSVDQHTDDHHVIRGLTASLSHRDNHYSVGTYEGYDMSIVDRLDTYIDTHDQIHRQLWTIIEIDLHTNSYPHLFLEPSGHTKTIYERLFQGSSSLQAMFYIDSQIHSQEFHQRYTVHVAPSHSLEAERHLTPDVSAVLAAHAWPFAFEIKEGSLYTYATNSTITLQLLETMTKNSIWLAQTLDNLVEQRD